MTRRKRDAPISYRPPEDLRAEFHRRALNSGLSVNAFITAAVFGREAARGRRTSPIDQRMTAMLLAQAAKIADRLTENVGMHADCETLVGECRDELSEIRNALMASLGRDA